MFFKKFMVGVLMISSISYAKLPDSNAIGVPSSTETIVHNGVTYGTVTSPHTGRVWLDRNLGASRVCQSTNDEQCYGDYYQWGRGTDGHEKFNSEITTYQASSISNTGNKFIYGEHDWASTDTNFINRIQKWGSADGLGVCPTGYTVPTIEELTREINTSKILNNVDAYNSFLKLPSPGWRRLGDASMYYISKGGKIWTISLGYNNWYIYSLDYGSSRVSISDDSPAQGYSVRCIKAIQNQPPTANAGANQTVTLGASVTLDASDSTDSDGSIVSYEWREYSTLLSTDVSFSKSDFPEGIHIITLTVTDNGGAVSRDVAIVIVNGNDTWKVTAKKKYEIRKDQFFSKKFRVDLYNIFPNYTDEERANVTAEEIQREYDPKNLTISLDNSNLDLTCTLRSEGSVIGAECKISGTLDSTQSATLLVSDSKHSFSKSIDMEFAISNYKLERFVTDDAFIILNGDDITHHISFGFDAKSTSSEWPDCTFKYKNGESSPTMFIKKVEGTEHRYICSTSDYKWEGGYYGSVDIYKLLDAAKEGNIEVHVGYGDKNKTINVPVYARNELTANAVLEYAWGEATLDPMIGAVTVDKSKQFVVVNNRVYSMDSLPDKIYLGGTALQGTNNQDFVYIKGGGTWKLTFQGHEILIRLERYGRRSNLAFTVDGSDLTKNSEIVEFIADPNSTYGMLLKKTYKARCYMGLIGAIYTEFIPEKIISEYDDPNIGFSECESENDLQNKEPTEYHTHPCYQYDWRDFADTTAGVRGTTLQITKDENKSAVFNLLEGEVVMSSKNLENNITLTDMESFDSGSSVKSKIKEDTLDNIQKRYLENTKLNSVDANQSLGTVTVRTNIDTAKYYLLGKNIQYGYGKETVFEDVAEGNYTLRFLQANQYSEPNDVEIHITKDVLNQESTGTYKKKIDVTPIIMYLLN